MSTVPRRAIYFEWPRRSFHAGSIPVSARISLPTVNTRAPDKYSAQILTNTRHKCEHISLTFPAMEPLFIVTGGRWLERQETDKYLPLTNIFLSQIVYSHTPAFSVGSNSEVGGGVRTTVHSEELTLVV